MSLKRNLHCQFCECPLHKSEAEFIDEESFDFALRKPKFIPVGAYCFTCFEGKVKSAVDDYNEKMERAKNVNVFYISQNKESRFVRRNEEPLKIEDCDDRDEVILRLAFLAVEADKNALVDLDFSTRKVYNGGWKTTRWTGWAIPGTVDESKLK